MRRNIRLISLSIASLALLVSSTSLVAQTPAYEAGQSVEVREGDTWSKATIVKKEGRKYQIKYTDGTDEWVTTDRIRLPGTTSPATPTTPATPVPGDATDKPDATTPPPAKAKPPLWTIGQDVEVKWGLMWRKAKILNRRGEWLLISYDNAFFEWVEPWRIRKIGSTEDIPYAAPNPSVKKTEPPPRDKPGAAPEKSDADKNDAFAPEPFDLPVTPTDLSAMKTIVPALATPWSYKPAAAITGPTLTRPLALRGGLQNDARPKVFDIVAKQAMVGYQMDGGAKGSSVEIIDTATGKSRQIKLDKASGALALTPDGTRVIARSIGDFAKPRIDVWDITGAEAKQVISFVPHFEKDAKPRNVDDVFVIDDAHIVTRGGDTLTGWQLNGARAIWSIEAGSADIAQSPDRKTLASFAGGVVRLIDATTGEIVGIVSDEVPDMDHPVFSPSGARLFGATTGGGIATIDLASGVANPIVAVMDATIVQPLSDHLVNVGSAVIDVDRGVFVGKVIEPTQQPPRMIGNLLATIVDGKPRSLCVWKLPIAELDTISTSAGTSKTIRLDATANVAADLALPGDAPGADAAMTSLRAALTKNGVKIADGSSLRLIARVEDGKTDERMYETSNGMFPPGFGPPRGDTERLKVSVVEKITRVWLELEGKKVWEASHTTQPPSHVDRKDGQSIPDAVHEANKPNFEWLKHFVLPRYVLVGDTSALKTIELVPGGVK